MVSNVKCSKCGVLVSAKNLTRHQKSSACLTNFRCDVTKTSTSNNKKTCDHCGNSVLTKNWTRHKKSKFCQFFNASDEGQPLTGEVKNLKRKRDDENEYGNHTKKACGNKKQSLSSSSSNSNKGNAPSTSSANYNSFINNRGLKIKLIETAFKGRILTAYLEPTDKLAKDPPTFLIEARDESVCFIEEHLKQCELKVNFLLLAEYDKSHSTDEVREINFKTRNKVILATTDIESMYETASKDILKEMEEFVTKGSGWTLRNIERLELRINRYKPLKGSSFIKLPAELRVKKAIINVKNNDQKCFLWSVLSALYPAQLHSDRVSSYLMHEQKLCKALKGIQYPVPLGAIPNFEKRTGISINVYSYRHEKDLMTNKNKTVIYPLLITKEEKSKHIDLLYIKDGGNSHYCYIKNFSRLVRSQITKKTCEIFICKRCLSHFNRSDLLEKHTRDCNSHEAVRIVMPSEGESVKFKSHHRMMKVPFVMYADFESMLTPEPQPDVSQSNHSFTHRYQAHHPISFCIYVVGKNGSVLPSYEEPITYFGIDAADKFMSQVREIAAAVTKLYEKDSAVKMVLTPSDLIQISNAVVCHICGDNLKGKKTKNGSPDYAVKDHDHLTGEFRGMAHNSCNLKFRKPGFIPLFIHNLSKYDTHLFIRNVSPNETINVIPNTEENYISYTIRIKDCISVRFLDSFRFMASSLDTLSSNLTQHQLIHTAQHFEADKMDLVKKKGTYPYDEMSDLDKYNMTSLPPRSAFYNRLKKAEISDEDYRHAEEVWKQFEIKNMLEYTLHYNKSDVTLLADVMENFRNLCLSTYGLDPAWYLTAPGLSWEAMLKHTSANIQLLHDYDMILMLTKGIRGGLSQCSHRLAESNNPYMNEGYNDESPTEYLVYWDANNLYGWAQSQPMPYGDFQWCDTNIDVRDVLDDSPTGYILEVDLEYPEDHHELHSDFPLAPEHRTPPGSRQDKLLSTLFDKKCYVVHYRTLKFYLSKGMKLLKIHRVLSFSQKAWMKPYIDLNTEKRAQACNDFEKDFFKLMNNSVFGKTVENIRNRIDVRLATQAKQVERLIAKPNFIDRTIFNESLVAIHMAKTKLVFNKPIYVGMSILDVSKILMYKFHYNTIKHRYGALAKLLYTDTDSLVYSIQTPDIYEDIKSMIKEFDTSNYPQPNQFNMPSVNKKVLGKMKDELSGHLLLQFVGLRAKMYAMVVQEQEQIKKSKGISYSVVKKELNFDTYKEVLLKSNIQYRTMNTIRSYQHQLYSVEVRKVALSADDDKRYICEDGITTLPWGHKNIP